MSEFFVARQPIFDRNLRVHAYELLFRDCTEAETSDESDQNAATAHVLTAASELGISNLVGNRIAYVNLPERFLVEPDLLPLPPDQLVLEVLETVEVNESVIAGMNLLRERGYTLALDDFSYAPSYDDALKIVSIVKLDIQLIEPEAWLSEIKRLKQANLKIIAEKIESEAQFHQLRQMGCDFFQGFFFAKPNTVSGKRPDTNKAAMMRLLSEINNPNTEPDRLADLVSRDVALSLRALTYVNSAASALNRRIESVREAILYLGRDTIRNWVTLYLMFSIDSKPSELVAMALVRARFCELLALELNLDDSGKFFTVGLFSTLDALMDNPMEQLLEQLTLTGVIYDALVHREGPAGSALQIAIDLERNKELTTAIIGIRKQRLARLFIEAMAWATETEVSNSPN